MRDSTPTTLSQIHGARPGVRTFTVFVSLLAMTMLFAGCPKEPPKPEAECGEENPCPAGKKCEAGRCVTAATEKAKQACSTDADCESPKVCKGGVCAFQCTANSQCGAGQKCDGNRCVADISDTLDMGCKLDAVYFDFDQSYIREDAKNTLKANAQCMKERDVKTVTVYGHCDERGDEAYNMALGQRRADSTRKYLMQLQPGKVTIKSVSKGEAAARSCETESCWQKDRRGEFSE